MKIGVRGHDLNTNDPDQIIKICHQHGIEGLQLVIKKTFPEQFMDDQFLSDQIKKFRVAGIEIFLLGSYFNMIHPDPNQLQIGIETFKRNTQIAKANDITVIGSETGSVNGDEWTYNPLNHTVESREKLNRTIRQIMTGLEPVNYLLEPVYDHVVYDHNITMKMVELHNMSLTFDLVNVLNLENYQEYEQIFESYLNNFGTRIKLLHFKNFKIINDKMVGCELGEGEIDYAKLLPLVEKYKLTEIPVIIEELEGAPLFNSISYLRKLDAELIGEQRD